MPAPSARHLFASALAALTLAAVPATAQADEYTPAMGGAAYLQGRLAAGDHHLSVSYGDTVYPDPGLTADAILALDAVGAGQDEAVAATAWLADNLASYVSFGDDRYAGALAKSLNVALAQGVDPHAFGGFDLPAELSALQQDTGRFVDKSTYGDYSNTIGQSLAVVGLARMGSEAAAAGADYLLRQQCPGGGFRITMADQRCTNSGDAETDATSFAIQALRAAGAQDSALAAARDYLTKTQAEDGSFTGSATAPDANSNSTGLAAAALLAVGARDSARSAQDFLTSLQYDCGLPAPLRGGVAYDRAAFDAARSTPGGAEPSDQDTRATAQALLGLAGVPLDAISAEGAMADAWPWPCTAPTTSPTPSPSPTGPVIDTDLPEPANHAPVGWWLLAPVAFAGVAGWVTARVRRPGAHR